MNTPDDVPPEDVLGDAVWTVLDAAAVVLVAVSVGLALFVHIGWWAFALSGLIIFGWARLAELVPELLAVRRERAAEREREQTR